MQKVMLISSLLSQVVCHAEIDLQPVIKSTDMYHLNARIIHLPMIVPIENPLREPRFVKVASYSSPSK